MNILKQMGIQQWRHRSAAPVVDLASVENTQERVEALPEQSESTVVNTDLRAALSVQPAVDNSGFDNPPVIQEQTSPIQDTSNNASLSGFSGSLRQALNQSISDKEKKKKGNSAPKQSSSESTLGNESEQAAVEVKGGVTPINLSALIPETEPVSNDVLHELAELSDGNEHLMQDGASIGSHERMDSHELINNNSHELIGNNSELVGNSSFEPVSSSLEPVNNSFEAVSSNKPENGATSLLDDSDIVTRDLAKVEWPGLQKLIETNEHCPSCGWGNGHLGAGNQDADWLFVIDAPNSRDIQAQALFSGRAGQLFDAMLSALGLSRENVYSTSVFKCAPTDDLSVTPQCDELVRRQIELVSPKVVVSFGEFAAQSIIKSNSPLDSLRLLDDQRCFRSQVAIIPTYSPAEMLDDARLKAQVWADLKKARSLTSA